MEDRACARSAGRLVSGMRIGPYEITGFLGAGGMGEVYRAHDSNLNRIVALKLLPADVARDAERLRRFELEARTASSLNHPAIVTVYEAGQIGAQAYISMELVAGETLREILRHGPLTLRRALRIASQLSEGLAKAHEAGLVHRDLKPENIKVPADGYAKILDFGLAKRLTPSMPEDATATQSAVDTGSGVVMGTAGYMSPEQASGGCVEFSSDQFSFGTILYEMLTGQRAFERSTTAETLSAIIREEPVSLAQLNPAIPPPVRWIVERCLAKEPEERYALTRDLARDLASVREHLSELLASRRGRTIRRDGGTASLAVLPVSNLSAGPEQEAMADAMTDALITELTHCPNLRVLSRPSSMMYRGRRYALPDIAEELEVEWIVVASLVKAGAEIRVCTQLVNAVTDENRWAQTYVRRARNILTMQSEVSAAVAEAVGRAILACDSVMAAAV